MAEIAKKHSVSPSDVLIAYPRMVIYYPKLTRNLPSTRVSVAKGYIVLAKSVIPARIASNLTGPVNAAAKLDKDDITVLDGLAASGKQKRSVLFLILYMPTCVNLLSRHFFAGLLPHPGVCIHYTPAETRFTDPLPCAFQPSSLDSSTGRY